MKHATFIAWYDRWILSHPVITLLLVALVLGGLATQLGNIKIDATADALVLEGDTDLEFYRESSARYASEDFLVLTFRPPGDLLGDESLGTLASLRDDLAAIRGVSSVTTILDVPLLQSPPISIKDIGESDEMATLESPGVDRELVRREFHDSPIYANLLVSEDGRTTAIQVNLPRDELYFELLNRRDSLRTLKASGELPANRREQLREAEQAFKRQSTATRDRENRVVDDVRAVADRYRDRADIFVGGVPMIAADMVTFIRSDLVTFGGGILVFMVVMLSVIFRRVRWVLLPMLTCCGTALFMLGLLAWLDWRMTVISSNFVAVLLTVGLAIAVHLVVRYRELHAEFPDAEQRELVLKTVQFMSVPCSYTALTTIVAFMSLVVSGIRPVIDFGWMMTIGIAVSLVLTFLVLPAAVSLMPKGAPVSRSERSRGLTVAVGHFTERHGKGILAVAALIFALCVWGISRLQVENRFIDYFQESTEIYQGMELLDAELGGTIPLDVVVDLNPKWTEFGLALPEQESAAEATWDGAEDDEWLEDDFAGDDDFAVDGESFEQSYWFTTRGMERVAAIHDYLDSLPETGKVLSLATLYEVIGQLLGGDISDVELALVQKSLPSSIKSILVDPYYDEETQQVRVTLRAKETSRDLRRNAFLKKVRRDIQQDAGLDDETLQLTNMLVLYNNVLQSLFKSQILTLGVVFLAIMAMFVILFRSFLLALLTVIPNMLAAMMVLGIMGLAGIPLDIMTVTIAAIVVGIGVDDTIHYVHRFRREFRVDRDYLATMHRCHGSIGKAMYYTSITIIVGFSILVLSNFNPSVYFGLLTGLAMFAALVGALLLLPQLILTFKPLGPGASS